jgi:hypothetical protein
MLELMEADEAMNIDESTAQADHRMLGRRAMTFIGSL